MGTVRSKALLTTFPYAWNLTRPVLITITIVVFGSHSFIAQKKNWFSWKWFNEQTDIYILVAIMPVIFISNSTNFLFCTQQCAQASHPGWQGTDLSSHVTGRSMSDSSSSRAVWRLPADSIFSLVFLHIAHQSYEQQETWNKHLLQYKSSTEKQNQAISAVC